MTLHLVVETGGRAGHRAPFDGAREVVVGRDVHADLRLDAVADRDASARHAALRLHDGVWRVRDLGSTNGTWVNARRIDGEVALRDGDRIRCGADGPTIAVLLARGDGGASPRANGRPPRRRVAALAAVAAATLAVGAGAYARVAERRAEARPLAAELARAASDSARDTVRADTSAARTPTAPSGGATTANAALAGAADAATSRPAAMPDRAPVPLAAAAVDASAREAAAALRRASAAVALVAVEAADGTASSGTAFGVEARGLLVTNRHVVLTSDGRPPRRVAVKYADTDAWLEARFVRAHPDADLALVEIVGGGRHPSVAGVAAADPAIGADIVVVGFPATAEAPGERALTDGVARAAAFRGHVGKVADGTLVIDAYAGRGSSGSPVLDARGAVVGVVYGGPREAAGRVAFAASGAALRALLR